MRSMSERFARAREPFLEAIRIRETNGRGARYSMVPSDVKGGSADMLYRRTDERRNETLRPTIPQPKTDPNFAGWGPRLRF